MKKFYDIKDRVWIHLGEQTLVEGRVVEIIDLEHLKEGYDPQHEFYVIEIPTSIEPVYEVRTFEQISPDSTGPLNLYRELGFEVNTANRVLKKMGIKMPDNALQTTPPDPATKSKFKKRYYKKKR